MTAAELQPEPNPQLSVASVCRTLPTPDNPYSGIFVMRRLAAMNRVARVHALQPIPYFPFLRPLDGWARQHSRDSWSVQVSHLPMFYFPGLLKRLDGYWLYRSIRASLRELRVRGLLDVVDAHFAYPDGVGALRAARELGVPAVATVRGVEEDQLKVPSIRRQIGWLLENVDGCICVSHSLRESMIAVGSGNNDRIRVIHNAIDRDVFRPQDKSAARARLAVPDDVRLIVAVGNLLSVKRHDVLMKALATLKDGDQLRLAIIGGVMHEPDYPARLRELATELGLADRVSFVGRISPEQVADWLAAADVFSLASRREGCCNAVLEALACGVPVVATAVGDNPWFVNDADNGFTVPPDDVEALARGIERALARTWDREQISAGLNVGNWTQVGEQVIEFLSQCKAATHRGASA